MVHRVEELRQVKIYDPYVPLVRDCERFVNRGLATPVGTKAMAVIAKYGCVFLAELLSYRLLDDTVCSGWDSQRSEFAFLLLWDHDSAHGPPLFALTCLYARFKLSRSKMDSSVSIRCLCLWRRLFLLVLRPTATVRLTLVPPGCALQAPLRIFSCCLVVGYVRRLLLLISAHPEHHPARSADFSQQALLRHPYWSGVRETSSSKNTLFPLM